MLSDLLISERTALTRYKNEINRSHKSIIKMFADSMNTNYFYFYLIPLKIDTYYIYIELYKQNYCLAEIGCFKIDELPTNSIIKSTDYKFDDKTEDYAVVSFYNKRGKLQDIPFSQLCEYFGESFKLKVMLADLAF